LFERTRRERALRGDETDVARDVTSTEEIEERGPETYC
jgi:hypothetical protein